MLGFYGTVTIKNTQVVENKTDGMIFSRNINDAGALGQSLVLDDEAGFYDVGDYTERSNNVHFGRNRSQTVVQPTENAMIEGSYRNEGAEGFMDKTEWVAYDRPFEE